MHCLRCKEWAHENGAEFEGLAGNFVTSASALCELVLIVTINEIALLCPGLPVVIEKINKTYPFCLFINPGYCIC
jgi:hypothetical protein